MWTDLPCIGWLTRNFQYLPAIFLFPISPAQWSIKNISKTLFLLISSSTKIIEFDNVKFPKNISSKDGVWREFLEIDSNGTSSKTWILKWSYYNVVDSKQICFFSHFWNHGLTPLIMLPVQLEAHSTTRGDVGIGKEKEIFSTVH